MELPAVITDNITDVLVKIVEFTNTRQKILTRNINYHTEPDFVPQDLEVDEFADIMQFAVDEHLKSKRLALCDSENVKFGANGSFRVQPTVDHKARKMLNINKDKYIEMQVDKIIENKINHRLAAELLRQKQSIVSIPE